MDKISIIVSTYKGSNSVYRCVDCAMKQDYPCFEVIVVDDNGRGEAEQLKTEEALKGFFCQKNFFYIVHEKNKNGSAARNTGIYNSSGKYIAFLDDDDLLHTDSIRLRYDKLSSMPEDYGIVFSSFTQFSTDGKKDFECIYNFEGDILVDYLEQKYHSPSSVIMIRRSVIDIIGYWDESFKRHQDWEYVSRILLIYKACAIEQLTVDRIVTWRNNAKNPKQFEENRLHYLNKMRPHIDILNKPIQKKIYFIHYTDIGKNYLKSYKIGKSLKWAAQSGSFFAAIISYIKAIYLYLKKR